ncbi:MAG TPA: hypothetical protein VGB98_08760, partial [Pyrinomonadaceae bacterium]
VIPKTWAVTNLSTLRPGDPVNLEVDIIAKYVERILSHGGGRAEPSTPLTAERLAELGYT